MVVMVLLGILLINSNYIQVIKADSLKNNPYNYRLTLDAYSKPRGSIVIGGQPVASSTETNDALKFLRKYANGPLYAPVTGYNSLSYGRAGIESAKNSILNGTDDSLFVGRLVNLFSGKNQQGGNVTLTINPAAQKAAYDGLHGREGAVVALDPTTGAILALASSPSYDPNLLVSHDTGVEQKAWQANLADKANPMLDRALSETYPPGSTFKLITAAAALSSGQVTPDTVVNAPDPLPLPGTTTTLPNESGDACTAVTVTVALERSCNTVYGYLGMNVVGADALKSQAEKFGYNSKVSVPMTSATSVFPSGLNKPQTAQSAIGQFDVRVTPLQAAMVAAGIANKGKVMKPYLVQEVRAPNLSVIDQAKPEEMSQAVTPDVAQELTTMMTGVVDNGTGTNAQIDGIKVAGKTGTAQHGENNTSNPYAWFVSFAPADNPKVAVAVVVYDQNVGRGDISGNEFAAPIAKSVMQAVLNQR
jgi:peptidoglycan glycosyltransferase